MEELQKIVRGNESIAVLDQPVDTADKQPLIWVVKIDRGDHVSAQRSLPSALETAARNHAESQYPAEAVSQEHMDPTHGAFPLSS